MSDETNYGHKTCKLSILLIFPHWKKGRLWVPIRQLLRVLPNLRSLPNLGKARVEFDSRTLTVRLLHFILFSSHLGCYSINLMLPAIRYETEKWRRPGGHGATMVSPAPLMPLLSSEEAAVWSYPTLCELRSEKGTLRVYRPGSIGYFGRTAGSSSIWQSAHCCDGLHTTASTNYTIHL